MKQDDIRICARCGEEIEYQEGYIHIWWTNKVRYSGYWCGGDKNKSHVYFELDEYIKQLES